MARQVAQRYLVFPKLPTSLENKITILYPPTETLALHFAVSETLMLLIAPHSVFRLKGYGFYPHTSIWIAGTLHWPRL